MAQERIGRAVLELTTEGGSFYKGIEEARGQLRSLGQTIKQINSDSARMARSFSGRDSISDAVKLTNVIDRLGGAHRMTAANQARANTVLNEGAAAWQALGHAATPAYAKIQQYAVATQQAVGPTQALSQNLGVMAGAGFLAAQATSGLIESVANIGKESILTAARTQGLVAVADYLGQKEGKTKGEVDDLIRSINEQGITMQESANLVVQLSRAHLGLENATKLAAVAQNAAFISGMNSSDALDNIIAGIITLQPRLLRTAGITVTFEQAELAAAKAAGRTVESLTAEEKQVIALNETLRAGAQIAGVYGLSMQYVGKQLTSLPRFLQDAESSVGEVFLPTLSIAVTVATDLLKVIREYPKTFIAMAAGVTSGAAVAGLFAGGMLGLSAAVLAGGVALLGITGLIVNYIAKATDGTHASERFAAAAGMSVDKLTTEQRELLKLAGRMHDAQVAQEMVATATGRTSDQLSAQEKATIQSQVTWNNWIDALEEVWARYKRLDFWTPTPIKPSDIPALPTAPDLGQSARMPKGLAPDAGGLLVEGRDLGAAQREVANANRDFNAEVVKGGATLKYLIEHLKELYAGVDIDTAEKAIASRVGVSAATVRRLREDVAETNKELAKTPFAKFKENLKQLGLDLKSDVGKLDDTLFKEEFGRRIEDATRDITRWGDQMKKSGVQIPAEVTAAMLRLNAIDLADWSRKEAADLATLTDSLKGLGAVAVATDEAITAKVGEAIAQRVDIAKDATRSQADLENRRLEHEIDIAKQRGASAIGVYALEHQLGQQRLAQAIAESNQEFALRSAAMDKTTQAGRDAYDDFVRAHAVDVQRMVEDFTLGEAEKQEALRHTYNVWVRAWDQMRSTAEGTIGSVASGIAKIENETVGKLGTILFGFGHDQSGDMKRAADDARLQYLHIANSGKATAEELGLAFRRWHEAENRANYTFGERFKDVWRSVKSTLQDILNDLLKYFTEQFLVGMIKGISGAKLGQRLGGALAAGMPMAGGSGGGLANGIVQGGLNSVNPLGGNQNSLMRLLHLGGGGGSGFGLGQVAPGVIASSAANAGALVAPPAFLAGAPALGATGGGVVAGSTVPASAGASLASMLAGPAAGGLVGGLVGYKTGSKTFGVLSGAATGAAVGAMFGGPIGAGIGAGVGALAGLIGGILGGKGKANKVRDQFLAQFATFDTKRDPNNPPGFYGLAALTTKYKQQPLFDALVQARNQKDVKKAEQTIASWSASALHRNLKVFHGGGLIDATPINSAGEVEIRALKGEAVLTQGATQSIGGRPAVDALNAQPAVAKAAGAAIGGLFGKRSATGSAMGGLFGLFHHQHASPAMLMQTIAGDMATGSAFGGPVPYTIGGRVRGFGGVFHDGGVVGDDAGTEDVLQSIGGSSMANALNVLSAGAKSHGHIGNVFSRLFGVGHTAKKPTVGAPAPLADGEEILGSFGALAAQIGSTMSAQIGGVMSTMRTAIPQLQMPMLAPAGPRIGLMPLANAGSGRTIEVHYHDHTKHTIQAWDGEDAERAYKRTIRQQIKNDLAFNRAELITIIKKWVE